MIGDHTGSVHIVEHQSLILTRDYIDIPYNTYLYEKGFLW